jgi:predicted SAM-dependent methyltransferase
MKQMKTLRLHLGCGKRCLPGYIHIDLADYDHIDYRHGVDRLPMFQDKTVDLIYASHVLEYFDRVEVRSVLQEWRRALKDEGILRLAVPDFEALARVYSETGDLSLILGPMYGRWEIPGTGATVYHKTVYDETSLRELLASAGFSHIQRWNWRTVFTGEWQGFDDYSQAYIPHLDKEHGRLISLNIEAQR